MHEGVYRHAWSKSLHKGGSGLEIVAWLGDLGGGAGKLAIDRVGKPKKTVEVTSKNRSSDHGVSINLEADIGTYVITTIGMRSRATDRASSNWWLLSTLILVLPVVLLFGPLG